jgi:hypothetical protein
MNEPLIFRKSIGRFFRLENEPRSLPKILQRYGELCHGGVAVRLGLVVGCLRHDLALIHVLDAPKLLLSLGFAGRSLAQSCLSLKQPGALLRRAQSHDDCTGRHEIIDVVEDLRYPAGGLRRHGALIDRLDRPVERALHGRQARPNGGGLELRRGCGLGDLGGLFACSERQHAQQHRDGASCRKGSGHFKPSSTEGGARSHTDLLEKDGQRTKPRECRLEEIDAHEGREEEPVRAHQMPQNQAQHHHGAGEG